MHIHYHWGRCKVEFHGYLPTWVLGPTAISPLSKCMTSHGVRPIKQEIRGRSCHHKMPFRFLDKLFPGDRADPPIAADVPVYAILGRYECTRGRQRCSVPRSRPLRLNLSLLKQVMDLTQVKSDIKLQLFCEKGRLLGC